MDSGGTISNCWLKRHPRYQVHFTPTSANWPNLVERLFAEVTERFVRRGSHTMLDYLDDRNQKPKPFVWTASADLILGKVRSTSDPPTPSGVDKWKVELIPCRREYGDCSFHPRVDVWNEHF